MSEVTEVLEKFFKHMPEHLSAEAAKGVDAAIQFELNGDGGGNWFLEVKDGSCKVTQGTRESVNMTVSLSAADYVGLIRGKLDGQTAFMNGKLKIAGDIGLAMKMQSLFEAKSG